MEEVHPSFITLILKAKEVEGTHPSSWRRNREEPRCVPPPSSLLHPGSPQFRRRQDGGTPLLLRVEIEGNRGGEGVFPPPGVEIEGNQGGGGPVPPLASIWKATGTEGLRIKIEGSGVEEGLSSWCQNRMPSRQ